MNCCGTPLCFKCKRLLSVLRVDILEHIHYLITDHLFSNEVVQSDSKSLIMKGLAKAQTKSRRLEKLASNILLPLSSCYMMVL